MATKSEVMDVILRKSDDLCKVAEMIGYKETGRFAINQLQCKNGAYVSSLLRLLDDNPDLMETVRDWVLKKRDDLIEEEPEEVEEEEEDV